jgi:hypothetical protein
MPVRINLLPKYVLLKKYFQWALIACVGGSIIWILALALIYANTQVEIKTLQASTENVEPNAQAAEAAQAAKKKADDAKAPIDADVKFILAASQTGAERSSLLDQFSNYVYHGPNSVISEIDLSDGKTAVIQGMVKSPDDYARFITTLRQGTAPVGTLFAKLPVGTNGVPGYPKLKSETTTNNDNKSNTQLTMVVFPLTAEVKGDLLNPITVPTAPGAATPAASAGAPGMPPDASAPPPPDEPAE